MRIAVFGAGRLGSILIEALRGGDNEIRVVDRNGRTLSHLGEIPGVQVISGDLFEEETLHSFLGEGCDIFIAATGDDPHNILAAQLAKRRFHVPRVIIRLSEPELAQVYRHLGFESICPTELALGELKRMLKQ